jgi:hypothetical protein
MRSPCSTKQSGNRGWTGPTEQSCPHSSDCCPTHSANTAWSHPAPSCAGTTAWSPKWTYPHRSGRPPLNDTTAALIEKIAKENTTWDDQRIQKELLKLVTTTSALRQSAGSSLSDRYHQHHPDTPWRQLLRTQATTMLAVDFFPADYAVTLTRISVLFALEVSSRSCASLAYPRTQTAREPLNRPVIF